MIRDLYRIYTLESVRQLLNDMYERLSQFFLKVRRHEAASPQERIKIDQEFLHLSESLELLYLKFEYALMERMHKDALNLYAQMRRKPDDAEIAERYLETVEDLYEEIRKAKTKLYFKTWFLKKIARQHGQHVRRLDKKLHKAWSHRKAKIDKKMQKKQEKKAAKAPEPLQFPKQQKAA